MLTIVSMIPWLNAILENDEDYFNDPVNTREINNFFAQGLDSWTLKDIEPAAFLEVAVLSKLVENKAEYEEEESPLINHYYEVFSNVFFDPVHGSKLSVMGWLNYNYCRELEVDGETPTQSLIILEDYLTELCKASPTCDETLSDHIYSRIAEINDEGDIEGMEMYFYTDMNTQCFELSKLLNIFRKRILDAIDCGNSESILESVLVEILDELHELVETIRNETDQDEQQYHAITILDNVVEGLRQDVFDAMTK